MSEVSLTPGHESLAKPSVTAAIAPSHHSSSSILFSQYRGPNLFNMAEILMPSECIERNIRRIGVFDLMAMNFRLIYLGHVDQ